MIGKEKRCTFLLHKPMFTFILHQDVALGKAAMLFQTEMPIRFIAVKNGIDIHVCLRINCYNFDDPLFFFDTRSKFYFFLFNTSDQTPSKQTTFPSGSAA